MKETVSGCFFLNTVYMLSHVKFTECRLNDHRESAENENGPTAKLFYGDYNDLLTSD